MSARQWIAIALFSSWLMAAGGASADSEGNEGNGISVSGSLKSLLIGSSTLGGEDYTLSLNRARLEFKASPAEGVALDVQLDNELLFGSYLDTAAFRALKDAPPTQYWRADANTFERGDAYGRIHLYRGTITMSRGPVDVKVGRQRIAWGTGRFWSPLDVLNPVSPLAIERDERPGVDAVLAEAKLGPLSRLSLVYAPAPQGGPPSRAIQWHSNVGGIDGSVVIGRMSGFDMIGADMAGQLGQAGVRAEVARLRESDALPFTRAMAGVDYAFAAGLTVTAELFYNGAGSRDPLQYDFAGRLAGRVLYLATRYAGLYASYDLTPLLKWTTSLVLNLDDRSRGVDSRLIWSWRPNVDFTVGFQRFSGERLTEYGSLPNAAIAQWQWFF